MSKSLLEQLAEQQASIPLQYLFTPCTLPSYLLSDRSVRFVPFDLLKDKENEHVQDIQQFMQRKVMAGTLRQGRRKVRMHKGIEELMGNSSSLHKLGRFYNRTNKKLPKRLRDHPQDGFIIPERRDTIYLLLGGIVYKADLNDVKPTLLENIFGAEIADLFNANFQRAIEQIALCETYEEAQALGIEAITFE